MERRHRRFSGCACTFVAVDTPPYVEEDRRLTMKKQRRAEYLAKSEVRDGRDLKELTEQAKASSETIAMYAMDLYGALGEPLSEEELR